MNKKKFWLDTKPAESLNQIYQSCLFRLKDIKAKLDLLDKKYQIEDCNLFRTFSSLSASLNRVRVLVGIEEIRSRRDIIDIIKIINHNIKVTYDEREKEMQREALNREILIQEAKDVPEENEEKLKEELRAFFNFSNKLTKIIREKQEENSQLNKLDKKKFDPLITPLLNSVRKKYIKISSQNELDLDVLISVLDQIESALDMDYMELIDSVESIAFTCQKYLLSFYQEHDNIESKMVGKLSDLLEQVVKYDSKTAWLAKCINKYIKKLRNIRQSFTNLDGVVLKQFSDTGHQLSARFDLGKLQILLIIPEHSYLLNECIKMLREWIEYDGLYVKMVENDILHIERKRKSLLNEKIVFDRLFGQLVRRLDLIKKELIESSASLKVNLVDMCTKKPSFGADLRTFFDQIEMELSQIEKEMNKLNLVGSTDALKWSMLKGQLECLEYHMRKNYGLKKIEQHDLDVLDAGWLKLKNIHLYKISDQTLEKIFYGLELPKFRFGHQSTDLESDRQPVNELFMDVIELVSKLIGSDWIKLYYALPFYPVRGSEIIKKDVDKIYNLYYRGYSEKDKAFNSLLKWKRVHHRSKLDDICQALKNINRADVLKEVNGFCTSYESKKNKVPSYQLNRKSSEGEEDLKKKEAEILHQQLCKFFDSKNIKTKQFDFKFCNKNPQQ